ncbi:MAG: 50S ribosomal protein L6 [Candidatus Yonathbacteria bacterium]|nr:50S ribosomal protein L6 [Candidatus Yonathbacteria bacterium]NTW47514.1 50S ribosomal protein L6 [Candidatus Yonathbacteria bacterium]
MSRIGKQQITLPAKTEIIRDGIVLTVKGPLGTLSRDFPHKEIDIVVENGVVSFVQKKNTPFTRALWGTYASHVRNMVDGVNKPYEKKLIVEGVGFKADVKGNEIVMALGFSHPVTVTIPEGITVTSEKNTLTFSSIDKELIGRFAAKVRALKKPEPYKGKGIRYDGEVIRRKQGKKSAK